MLSSTSRDGRPAPTPGASPAAAGELEPDLPRAPPPAWRGAAPGGARANTNRDASNRQIGTKGPEPAWAADSAVRDDRQLGGAQGDGYAPADKTALEDAPRARGTRTQE